ncbi:hypothetical protein [Actinacidiphila epipremni]|uniref:Uncharacterized protein n=1 Tax=Actinacidiphila epipremni TaxID=2053013 RepID=A0ABX0ZGM6_9ACTN|nr:hypothetical protein [Actinacidiphila epipremni]NJP42287.1 hypothetical protein [Actinacidiphila epipremni]
MTDTDLSRAETRIARGIDQLARSAAAWFAADDVDEHRTRTALGRTLGGGIAAWVVGGVAYELGPVAWGSAGALAVLSVLVAGAPETEAEDDDQDDADDEPAEDDADDEPPLDFDDFLDLIHDVAGGGNVHLTAIGAQLAAETGRQWDVLALCRAAGIRTRQVRVPGADPAVTTGIHRTDLPPLPQPDPAPGGVVAAGHTDNNNSDNTTKTAIGEGGLLVKHGPVDRQEARR